MQRLIVRNFKLKNVFNRQFSSSKRDEKLESIRNIGILAHIDAG